MLVHQNHTCTPHVHANSANLSAKRSAIISKQLSWRPPFTKHHFKLLDDIWRPPFTKHHFKLFDDIWWCEGFQTAKRLGPQSINIRYSCCPKCNPISILRNIKPAQLPMYWGWIYQLAFSAILDYRSYLSFSHS